MFGLVGIEVTLCLLGNGDGVLAFVIFGHIGRYYIAGCNGGGQVYVSTCWVGCK